jgi:protoporphyrin/coproporphyrin ferrochelatase
MTGVILLNMGGPDSLDSVSPFLHNLFSDRDIIRLGPAFFQRPFARLISAVRAKRSRGIYSLIGGKSPLADITAAQVGALESELVSGGKSYRVYAGMTYWQPFIKDVVAKMVADGASEIVALSLYPQYSKATTGPAMKQFREAAEKAGTRYHCIESWCDHPLYVDALCEKIEAGIATFIARPALLFSAHSLPQRFIDEGDSYLEHTIRTIDAVTDRVRMEWHLSFQSRSGPVKWMGPSTGQMLGDLAEKGVKDLLVVPVSFVSDHIETLYEIDILYRDMAAKLGINLRRTESLNTSPKFIKALADLVIKG